MTKTFNRKCVYCNRNFGHWRAHWNHQRTCKVTVVPEELVCHDLKCRGANLCERCRGLLDRYEPGEAPR